MPESIVTRRCNVCKNEKILDEFPPIKIFPLGKGYTCRPCHSKRCHDWNIRNRNRFYRNAKKSRIKNIDKCKARWALGNAIKAGKINRPNACQKCGIKCTPQGHHYSGYAPEFWLDVEWLCKHCHNLTRRDEFTSHPKTVKG